MKTGNHGNAHGRGRIGFAGAAAAAVAVAMLLAVALRSPSPAAADTVRVHLEPHFTSGQVLRYQIDMRNVTKGQATGPVKDPEAASQLSQSTTVIVRLEILPPAPPPAAAAASAAATAPTPAPASGAGNTRIRATYEHSEATNESDAYDEQAEELAEQYRKLEGQSIEFTIGADGRISDLTGLDAILHDFSALASVRGWMSNLAPGSGFPKRGIAIGDKWRTEEALPGAPLRGTVWRADSEYARNDECRASATAAAPAPTPAPTPTHTPEHTPGMGTPSNAAPISDATDTCAVIITQFKILQTAPHGDLTPPDYLHNGLRSSGSWTGAGESMSLISLRTGLVVSVTQSSNQEMNFTISSASSPSRMTYTGEVKSQSEIALLPEALAVSR